MESAEQTIALQEWLDFIGSEYLDSFVKGGGASVKFAVSRSSQTSNIASALENMALAKNCLFVQLNAIDSRVYMPQDIFFAIAGQVDWRRLARLAIIQLAESMEYIVDGVDPDDPVNIYGELGTVNGLQTASIKQRVRTALESKVSINRRMSRDFRVAMTQLCLLEEADSDEYGGQLLLDWVTGVNTRISNVRHFSIRTPVNRTTARHYLESALYWFNFTGYKATVVFMDTNRVTLQRRPEDRSRFYTKAMVAEHYELLRELIDSSDRLSNTLVIVASNPDFLDEDTKSRGFGSYEALMTRVMNDVRDKNQVNPMASLIRIS